MATVKLSTTKSANKLINYADKKAVEKSGLFCMPEYAKLQFSVTRSMYGKNDSIQAHHIIQSFKPGEVSPGEANLIGQELASAIGLGFEAVVYTHTDKEHTHNHIVINSVNFVDGKKLHLHGRQAIKKVRSLSDEICKEHNLSIVTEKSAEVRYTLAEKNILDKDGTSWKDEIREAVDLEKEKAHSYEDFKQNLFNNHGIAINDTKKHITYMHPSKNKAVRGNKLGENYEKEFLQNGFERQIRRKFSDNRELADGKTDDIIDAFERTRRKSKIKISIDESDRRNRIADEQSLTGERNRNQEPEIITRSPNSQRKSRDSFSREL